ncbi:MAG: type I-E CRISPR-associated protein Cas6/Cse3/CasE, partial [Gammaproteobacteria bacterium]
MYHLAEIGSLVPERYISTPEATMYLSKVLIEGDKTISAYQIHQRLWALFPRQAKANRDFLFRVEGQQPGLGCELLMQSAQTPQTTATTRVLGQKRFEPAFHVGQRLRFRLRANPIKTIKDPNKG